MFSRNWIAAIAALFVSVVANAAAPLEAFGTLPTLSNLSLSPDGATIAFVRGDEANRFLVITSIGSETPIAALNLGDQKFRNLEWADNTHLLIIGSLTTLPEGLMGHSSEFYVPMVFDLETKSVHRLFNHVSVPSGVKVMNVIAGWPMSRIVNGHTLVFLRGVYFPGQYSRSALFRFDLTSGTGSFVRGESAARVEDWIIDASGNIVAEADYYESEQHWKLKLYRDGEPINAVDVSASIETPEVEGLSEDGTAIVISLPDRENGSTYEQVALADGKISPWKPSDPSIGSLFSDFRTGRVTGGTRVTDQNDWAFFDPRAQIIWRSIRAAFKGATNVDLISWSQDKSKVVVRVFGPANGDTYFYVDMASHKAEPLGPAYNGINDVSPVKWIDYRAADGQTIHAYLTLPLDRDPKALPLIVLPHGGPHSRDEPGFDWLPQALASRGYAVLQPQFRGSAGFGPDLLTAGYGEFGRKMQTDLSDGVRTLAAQGLVDPKRVCIVGASYGGYAALAGATIDTGVYRCAVSIAGISDLSNQLEYWGWPKSHLDDRNQRFWDRFLGVSGPDDPKLDAISPIKHVSKVTIPILLIHGRDDSVVPFRQSGRMADALKAAGKQVEFVELNDEDHWLSKSKTRLQMLAATVKFLEANNPPQ